LQAARGLVRLAKEQGLSLTGPDGLLKQLTETVLETALDEELTEHLGHDKHAPASGGNVRNGTRSKTVLTEASGHVGIDVPRDRAGSFEPQIVRKRQRRLSGVDEIVLSLYAKGLTTGEISAHFAEIYGASVSKETVSRITDRVVEEMTDWSVRPLDEGRFLAVVANHGVGSATRESARTSCGVRSPRTRRGRSLSSAATRSRSARACTARLVRFRKY
jgi:putative transposase